jgi:hypothetical protein
MARSSECTEQYAQKVFDSAGIVRDAIFPNNRIAFGLPKIRKVGNLVGFASCVLGLRAEASRGEQHLKVNYELAARSRHYS